MQMNSYTFEKLAQYKEAELQQTLQRRRMLRDATAVGPERARPNRLRFAMTPNRQVRRLAVVLLNAVRTA